MPRSLPSNPSIKNLKNQAKSLLKAYQKNDPVCCNTFRLLQRFAKKSDNEILEADVALHEAQFALAMDYGFTSWNAMVKHIESMHQKETANSGWDIVMNRYLSGQINNDEAIQIIGKQYDELPRFFFEQAWKALDRFFFERDSDSLLEAQDIATKLLANSIRNDTIHHDIVIGLEDILSFATGAENFINGHIIAGYEHGTQIVTKTQTGIRFLGWRNQRSGDNRQINASLGLPLVNLIYQDSVFHFNANLTVPFPPVKVGNHIEDGNLLIESNSDEVTTPCGCFEGCLRLSTPEILERPVNRLLSMNGYPNDPIRKIAWYMSGLGLVKFQIIQNDQVIKEIQLRDYESPQMRIDAYFPVVTGIKWIYEWEWSHFICREITRPVGKVDIASNGEEYMYLHFAVIYLLRDSSIKT